MIDMLGNLRVKLAHLGSPGCWPVVAFFLFNASSHRTLVGLRTWASVYRPLSTLIRLVWQWACCPFIFLLVIYCVKGSDSKSCSLALKLLDAGGESLTLLDDSPVQLRLADGEVMDIVHAASEATF